MECVELQNQEREKGNYIYIGVCEGKTRQTSGDKETSIKAVEQANEKASGKS